MSDTLVAFYSRAGENYFGGRKVHVDVGNTKLAVGLVRKHIDADEFEIRQKEPYSDTYDICIAQAKKDLKNNARPEIEGFPERSDYQNIILAYPNYWGTVPMAVMTFLEGYDTDGKRILPLCTNEGSGMGRSEEDIRKACPGSSVSDGLAVTGSQAGSPETERRIAAWLKANIL
ncbi:MAG: flavodoxin [Methanomethylophilus sp.]|jgi:flavodoxin